MSFTSQNINQYEKLTIEDCTAAKKRHTAPRTVCLFRTMPPHIGLLTPLLESLQGLLFVNIFIVGLATSVVAEPAWQTSAVFRVVSRKYIHTWNEYHSNHREAKSKSPPITEPPTGGIIHHRGVIRKLHVVIFPTNVCTLKINPFVCDRKLSATFHTMSNGDIKSSTRSSCHHQ